MRRGSKPRKVSVALLLATVGVAPACTRLGFELQATELGDVPPTSLLTGVSTPSGANRTVSASDVSAPDVPFAPYLPNEGERGGRGPRGGEPRDGDPEDRVSGEPGPGPGPGRFGPDAGAPPPPQLSLSECGAAAPADTWGFGSALEGWGVESQPVVPLTATWLASGGNPVANGLARVDATLGAESVYFNLLMSETDLSGRTLEVSVYIETGVGLGLKLYAQSGVGYDWADDGRIFPPNGQWLCLRYEFSSPSAPTPFYDASRVVEFGLSLKGSGDVSVFVDRVGLQ